MIRFSKSEKETQKLAASLASKIMKSPSTRLPSIKLRISRASVITLEGELGAGKTTFVKGFARALGIKAKIKSPTFVLMRKYPLNAKSLKTKAGSQKALSLKLLALNFLYHLDCYRVRDHRDLATLDLGSLFTSPDNIVLIEWPERISKILPTKLIRVHIDHISENKRKIQIKDLRFRM